MLQRGNSVALVPIVHGIEISEAGINHSVCITKSLVEYTLHFAISGILTVTLMCDFQ